MHIPKRASKIAACRRWRYGCCCSSTMRSRYADNRGKRGQLRPTAAMAAGVVNRLWRFDDLMAGGVA
jgi:hypothetical protein